MKAAALVFVLSALFLAGALDGFVRVGTSQPAPRGIDVPRIASAVVGSASATRRSQVQKRVDASVVGRYQPRSTANRQGR